jgi:hypothetical protein
MRRRGVIHIFHLGPFPLGAFRLDAFGALAVFSLSRLATRPRKLGFAPVRVEPHPFLNSDNQPSEILECAVGVRSADVVPRRRSRQ